MNPTAASPRTDVVDAVAMVQSVEDRSARGIAGAVGQLIRSGAIPSGSRLPTVRDVARELGVSPTTVSEAWQALSRGGAIESRGRAGTFVRSEPQPHGPERYERITKGPGVYALDLSTGIPDADLLPDLSAIATDVALGGLTTNYLDDPVDPQLAEVLRRRWPFHPERLTVVDGCMDAVDRVLSALVRFGDLVLVENPTFPPILDRLGDLGAEAIPVDIDDDGPVPASLADGLEREPVLFVVQPRSQNPSGSSLTEQRAGELASLLAASKTIVVEDDHAGDVASSPLVSLGAWRPDATVHVSGFSKSHGPDLRLAAVGGAARVVDAIVSRRRLGPGWSSRILQRLLATMLTDAPTIERVAQARAVYAERRRNLSDALRGHGVRTTGNDGIYLWVPVLDETAALVYLASRGIGASPGTPFESAPLGSHHIRLTAGLVRTGADELAAEVAKAATSPPPIHRRR